MLRNDSMLCNTCGFQNSNDAKFCERCGSFLAQSSPVYAAQAVCPRCGCQNDASAKFCEYCGYILQAQPVSQNAGAVKILWADKYIGDKKIGYSKASGHLRVYPDRLEFSRRMRMGTVFGAVGKLVTAKKANEKGEFEAYYFKDIESCFFSQYAIAVPSMVLVFKSGDVVKFASLSKSSEINECITYINESLSKYRGAAGSAMPDKDAQFSFVMPITNMAAVDDRAIAVVGYVSKGSVKTGSFVSIISESGENKGSFEVRSLAVNKKIAQTAVNGNSDVALLIFCPQSFISRGDKACIPIQ